MSTLNLVFAEIRYRFLNVLLSLAAVVLAATLFVAGPTLLSGYAEDTNDRLAKMQEENDKQVAEMNKKTRRIMRDMGVNLRILHKDTNMGGLYTDFEAHDFDEQLVYRISKAESIETIVHLIATLQEKIKWNDRNILVVGALPVITVSQKNEEKPHMAQEIPVGMVLVGAELGIGKRAGDTIDVNGHELKIAKVMNAYGDEKDASLMMNLRDAQAILEREGKINMITALNCKCKGDRISAIQAELEGVLPKDPDTGAPLLRVVEINNLATAREQQRDLVEKKAKEQQALLKDNRDRTEKTIGALVTYCTPLAVLVAAVFIGLLTWLNVRERRPEIGLLRALGKGTVSIAGLFLLKSALLGLIGGLAGCGIGYGIALAIGQSMQIGSEFFRPDLLLLGGTIIGAPLVAALASYLPTLAAVSQDPAVVLMDN